MSAHETRRFQTFADFVYKTYPCSRTVADIAGGHGNLSFWLGELGYEATIIDPRETHLPRKLRRVLKKRSGREGRMIEIPRIVRRVQDVDLTPFDLLVGLHPDEPTEHLVRAAIALDKNLAVVPCCVFPIDGIKRSQGEWLEYLAKLSPDIETATLPMRGANTVLYRCAR